VTRQPQAEEQYLSALDGRLADALGPEVVGVYAGGSWALGDFLPGRSDLDVAVAVGGPLTGPAADRIVAGISHEALPCPARGLELVVYTSAAAGSGATGPAFELNFNTGAAIETRIDRDPEVEDAHWFAIDRAILAQAGIALRGPAAADLFNPPPREELLELLAASIRWQEERAGTPDAVLNACRALRFARTGQWTSKSVAGEWALDALGATEIVGAALASRRGNRGPDLDQRAALSFLRDAGRALAPPR
jgi:Domain of unknown function (DUF4111)/Nucleotidyltransferase domain